MHAEYLCPALTAFTGDGKFDVNAQHRLYRKLAASGLDGVIVLGSSGEFYGMSMDMCREVGLDAVQTLKNRLRVYVGCGRLDAREAIELSNEMLEAGATGVIIVGPYYIGASEEGIFSYFDRVTAGVHGDVIVYNYPDNTGYDVTPAILKRLIERHPNVIGVKDTVESATHTQAIIRAIKPEHPEFKVYSGYDNNFVPTVLAGGDGVIAAMSNMMPATCASWVRALKEEDFGAVAAIHAEVARLMEIYSISKPFMPAMKKVLDLQGLDFPQTCLLPAVPLSECALQKAERVAGRLDALGYR